MIQVDLLPDEFRTEEQNAFGIAALVSPKGILRLLAVAVIFSVILFLYKIVFVAPAYKKIQDQYDQYGKDVIRLQTMKAKVGTLQDQMRRIESAAARPFFWTEIMNGLSASVVDDIWLTHLKIKNMKVGMAPPSAGSLTGREEPIYAKTMILDGKVMADSEPTSVVSQFTSRMMSNDRLSHVFKDIRIENVRKEDKAEGLYAFEIYAEVKDDFAPVFEAFV